MRRSFDRVADRFDAAAAVQRHAADELNDRLSVIKLAPQRILDAGCGTGYALQGLRHRFPQAELIPLDFSTAMLQRVKARNLERAGVICGDVENIPIPDRSMDLIFSNLVLHWCNYEQVIAEFLRVLKPGGLLTFATFGPDTLRELRAAWAQVDTAPHVHEYTDMHNVGDILVQFQFSGPVMDVNYIAVTHRNLNDALVDLKALGTGNAVIAGHRGLSGAGKFRRLKKACENFRNEQGLLQSTMEIVYGHAWAPIQANLHDSGGGVAIPLSQLRRP